jgi:prolipoprotein diacylglyceryltransferase
MLGILLLLDRYRLPENTLFYVQGVLFCSLRFWIECYRDGATAYGGLTAVQWACVAGVVFFGWRLTRVLAPMLARPAGVPRLARVTG